MGDLAATRLVQPASRMQYNLLLAGSPAVIGAYQRWFQARARPGETTRDGRGCQSADR